eukprot:TRINITY_DN2237_c0_g1_i5.p1 TRINITY_DN2237_c0_g1~~TRINITY_DN2237_c0_g1_i5.p1  ORF type:complete len:262 (-),score=31.43 TRINITY_DN2237_c0_g1_i5:659-1363(-)
MASQQQDQSPTKKRRRSSFAEFEYKDPSSEAFLQNLRAKANSPANKKRKRRSLASSETGIQDLGKHKRTERLKVPEGEDPKVPTWVPPPSSYGLIQEILYKDPWKVLVVCMLLNRTSWTQVSGVIWKLFELCPSAKEALKVSKEEIVEIIRPLGIHTKRASDMLTMSEQYLNKDWRNPLELHGVGKYAADAYWIFCKGKWREVEPQDKELTKYHEWLHETDGLGRGFEAEQAVL